jgi:hypothetical protein
VNVLVVRKTAYKQALLRSIDLLEARALTRLDLEKKSILDATATLRSAIDSDPSLATETEVAE